MAVTYGFFNSVNGDRVYNADQMSEYFKGLVSDGVYENVGGALQVLAGTGMSVNVQTGRMIIDYKWLDVDAVLSVPITAAHVTLNRWTAVVARLDRTNRLMTITTKDGTPASSPIKPTLTNDGVTTEKCLAYIYVGANVTSITQANITDMRPSSSCGWVTGLVEQVDTSQLFLQWQTAYQNYYDTMQAQFDKWFSDLTDKLNVDTYIQRYYKRVVLDGKTTQIPLDMSGYTYSASDILFVHVNGLLASESVDYLLDTTSSPVILHPSTSVAGSVIEITVLKSKIGFSDGDVYKDAEEVSY